MLFGFPLLNPGRQLKTERFFVRNDPGPDHLTIFRLTTSLGDSIIHGNPKCFGMDYDDIMSGREIPGVKAT